MAMVVNFIPKKKKSTRNPETNSKFAPKNSGQITIIPISLK